MNHVITFDDDGTANTLWTDKLPLAELGTMKVKRASWIDFNEGTQQWEVRFDPNDNAPAFTDPSREACLAWEDAQLNR
jgi:hypothetical protein